MLKFIQLLEKNNELIRIKEYVNPILEIAEVTDRISKSKDRNKALLFENTGTQFPLLINSMGSYKRMCLALGVTELDTIADEIVAIFKNITTPKNSLIDKIMMLPQLSEIASWMPKSISSRGMCQEVIHLQPDITQLPILKCWPHDGGPFLTLPIVHTKDPNTHIRNVGLYRVQVFDTKLTALHWHKHKVSAAHYNEYKKINKIMPVAIAIGGDPIYSYVATAPLPSNVDEYMLAGLIRKNKVEMVKCITQDIEVPADCDIIIEGYVDTNENLILEGPFGDHTGYYSLADWYPRFHITAITHRKNAIYSATIVGIPPQEDAWIGKATERIFIAPIKLTMLPELRNMELPLAGVFHNLTIISIEKNYAGHAQKVTNTMWGAGQMMFNKILVVTDAMDDITDYKSLAQKISKNFDPSQDMMLSQGPMDVLDHACGKFAFGGKLSIDGTVKYEEEGTENLMAVFLKGIFNKNVKTQMLDKFDEIVNINYSLLNEEISLLIISVKKNRANHIRELNDQLFELCELQYVKLILYVEHTVDTDCLQDSIWRFCNNYDPKRDTYFVPAKQVGYPSHAGLDGTRKTKKYDNFQRDWPNVIVADDRTIAAIDAKWEKLGLGDFIPSPSLRYKNMVYGDSAIALE